MSRSTSGEENSGKAKPCLKIACEVCLVHYLERSVGWTLYARTYHSPAKAAMLVCGLAIQYII